MGIRTLLHHAILRRTATIFLLLVFIAFTVVLFPLIALLTLPFALAPGARARPIRFGAVLVAYLVAEVVGLFAATWLWLRLGLWIRAGDAGRDAAPSPAEARNEARRRRYQDANYALLARLLTWLYAAAARMFDLRVLLPEIIGAGGAGDAESLEPVATILEDGPLLVLSRHGGPGDSFLLVHALLVYAHRRPLIVLKDTLAFDPLIDVVLSRVPHCFITPRHALKGGAAELKGGAAEAGRDGAIPGQGGPGRAETIGERAETVESVESAESAEPGSTRTRPVATEPVAKSTSVATLSTPAQEDMAGAIGRMAAGMGPSDALLVFPEGANFTAGRRQRVIDRLRRQGRPRAALRAQRLRNVLPPHPNGVFAAVDAAPGASLVFVAHTGLDHMQSVADVWRGVPLDRPASVTWWTMPAARVPAQPEARLAWLQDNWAQVDRWITREQAALEP
jgi:1-acyl-sn-glycerol-3-phosphate acyltransferase